jgi:hypothetical protein
MGRSKRFLPVVFLMFSCGPRPRRDLGSIPMSAITYEDMCHLQEYFEQRVQSHAPPLRVVDEQATETSRHEQDEHGVMRPVVVGEGTYVLASRSDRIRFRRLLREEYRRLPEMNLTGPEQTVRVKVGWWQAGGIRRLRPDEDVVISTGDDSWTLPPHPCVGEFLFGEPAYVMRRCIQEAERARAAGQIPSPCSLHPEVSPSFLQLSDAGIPPRTDASD